MYAVTRRKSAEHPLRSNIILLYLWELNIRKYAFSNRVIDDWNLLPASCINCSTIDTFNSRNTGRLNSELESEAVKFKLGHVSCDSCDSRHYAAKVCAYRYSCQHRQCGGMLASVN